MNIKIIILILILLLSIGVSSGATIEMTAGKLLPQLHEGDLINLTIKISDYEDINNITIETSLMSSNNKPIFDFGDLNPSITDNRYNQKITLNKSSLPPNSFQVSISGRAPEGETRVKFGNDIIISKFSETKLKYYEVHADQKLAEIESFELIILKKEEFDKTLNEITWKELDDVKSEVVKLFNSGLTTEAQNIADKLTKIKIPNNLTLFGFIKIDNDIILDLIFFFGIVIFFVIGYVVGSRGSFEEEYE